MRNLTQTFLSSSSTSIPSPTATTSSQTKPISPNPTQNFKDKTLPWILSFLRTFCKWTVATIRLTIFTILCLPAFLQILKYWIWSPNVYKNIVYGEKERNVLDIYSTVGRTGDGRYPVVVFLSGGAWIIGYKAWGALMGKVMSSFGIVFVTPDYRNFPQGAMPDMVDDVDRAMQWIYQNIHFYDGDPENVTLVGQSAGAHIAACVLMEKVVDALSGKEKGGWCVSQIRGFIGISGAYNMQTAMHHFHKRGLDQSIILRIMNNDTIRYSPSLRLSQLLSTKHENLPSLFPPMTLFHGTADNSIDYHQSVEFEQLLKRAGIAVHAKYYPNKSHTDPIIEDPIVGNDPLMQDILQLVMPSITDEEFTVSTNKLMPLFFVQLARKVNPF